MARSKITEEDRSDLRWLLGFLGSLAVTAAVTYGFIYFGALYRDKTGPGKLQFAHLVHLRDGRSALVVVEDVTHGGGDGPDTSVGRLDLVDATSGARLARAIRVEAQDCHQAGADRLWCYERGEKPPHDQRLVLRDLGALGVVASAAQLEVGVPALGRGIATSAGSLYVEPDGGAAVAPTNDGATWRIEPGGCPTACRAAEVSGKLDYALTWRFGSSQHGTVSSAVVDGSDYVMTNPPRRALAVRTRAGDFGHLREDPVGSATFLGGEILADTETADAKTVRPIVLDGGLVIVHDDTLDRSARKTQLSLVGLDGAVRWSAEVGKGTVVASWRVRERGADVLVVAVQADPGWLLGIDPKSGRIRWRYDT